MEMVCQSNLILPNGIHIRLLLVLEHNITYISTSCFFSGVGGGVQWLAELCTLQYKVDRFHK